MTETKLVRVLNMVCYCIQLYND